MLLRISILGLLVALTECSQSFKECMKDQCQTDLAGLKFEPALSNALSCRAKCAIDDLVCHYGCYLSKKYSNAGIIKCAEYRGCLPPLFISKHIVGRDQIGTVMNDQIFPIQDFIENDHKKRVILSSSPLGQIPCQYFSFQLAQQGDNLDVVWASTRHASAFEHHSNFMILSDKQWFSKYRHGGSYWKEKFTVLDHAFRGTFVMILRELRTSRHIFQDVMVLSSYPLHNLPPNVFQQFDVTLKRLDYFKSLSSFQEPIQAEVCDEFD